MTIPLLFFYDKEKLDRKGGHVLAIEVVLILWYYNSLISIIMILIWMFLTNCNYSIQTKTCTEQLRRDLNCEGFIPGRDVHQSYRTNDSSHVMELVPDHLNNKATNKWAWVWIPDWVIKTAESENQCSIPDLGIFPNFNCPEFSWTITLNNSKQLLTLRHVLSLLVPYSFSIVKN